MKVYVGEVTVTIPFAALSKKDVETIHQHYIDLLRSNHLTPESSSAVVEVVCDYEEFKL
jgi:hypothetical protein